jgi:ubiquinone/menaquinone biosynthesis C-methylase UbiE
MNDRVKDTLRVYSNSEVAKEFGRKEASTGSVKLRNKLRQKVADMIVESGSKSILDVGCGNGLLANRLQGVEVIGLDFSSEMLKSSGIRKKVCGVAYKLPLKEDCVDMAVAIDMLHHLPSQEMQEKAVKELIRVSRGGIIFEVKTDDILSWFRRVPYTILRLLKIKEEKALDGMVYNKTDLKRMVNLLKSLGRKVNVMRVSYLVDWRIIKC